MPSNVALAHPVATRSLVLLSAPRKLLSPVCPPLSPVATLYELTTLDKPTTVFKVTTLFKLTARSLRVSGLTSPDMPPKVNHPTGLPPAVTDVSQRRSIIVSDDEEDLPAPTRNKGKEKVKSVSPVVYLPRILAHHIRALGRRPRARPCRQLSLRTRRRRRRKRRRTAAAAKRYAAAVALGPD